MAPRPRGRPRKSGSSTTTSSRVSDPLGSFPAPPPLTTGTSFVDSAYGSQSQQSYSQAQSQRVPLKPGASGLKSPVQARTPIHKRSPAKQGQGITIGQRQVLIDNLRLEITERARKLRAQYALQAASLRQRLEMRIHRVPAALRKLTLSEVIERHEQKLQNEAEAKARKAVEVEADTAKKTTETMRQEQPKQAPNTKAKAQNENPKKVTSKTTATRPQKRPSDELTDKENATAATYPKRARTALTTATKQPTKRAPPSTTTASRDVLSPKSHNSRTLPASPFKSPAKPTSRPPSPLKPSAMTSPVKPPTIPANVPAVANVATASSMAKTRNNKQAASTVQGKARAASKTTTTTTTTTTKKGTVKKTAVHVDVPEARRTLRSSNGRKSGDSDGTSASNGTVVQRPERSVGGVRGTAAKVAGSVRGTAVAAKKTAGVVTGATGGSVRGGRTLRKRA